MDLSIYITTLGMERLQKRINDLMTERPEVIKAVAIAREFGDLSENAEYKAAKERQRAIDSEIDYLRRRAATLKVIDPSHLPKDAVRFGSTCKTVDEHTDEEISFKIPPGIANGKKLRLAGKGAPSPSGGPPGDLYMNIQIQPHPIFTREGNDLYIEKSVRFSQATLGTVLDVPTLDGGTKRIKIPAGTQHNTKIRMKGYGAPGLKGAAKGDQYVKISVEVPKKLTDRQTKLIRQLDEEGL